MEIYIKKFPQLYKNNPFPCIKLVYFVRKIVIHTKKNIWDMTEYR